MRRNNWVYSIGCFVVWGILRAVAAAKAKNGTFHNVLLVFAGWTLCWATIARFMYPPPKRWLQRSESPVHQTHSGRRSSHGDRTPPNGGSRTRPGPEPHRRHSTLGGRLPVIIGSALLTSNRSIARPVRETPRR